MHRPALHALLLLAACGPGRPPDGTGGASGSASSLDSAGDSSAAPTTSTSSTTSTTSDDSTTSAETCGNWSSTALETVPGDPPMCVDPQVEWHEKHLDCALDCSTATELHGEGPAAALAGVTRISFDVVYGACGEGLQLRRLHLGSPYAPKAVVWAGIDCALDPWLGAHPVTGRLADDTEFTATMTIDGYAGDWDSPDPVDPPRLFGSFGGDLVGPFEAVHCAALDAYYDNCA
jgi:hypothetical protein